MFGCPRVIKVRQSEPYRDVRERIRALLGGVPDKDFDKYKFNIVAQGALLLFSISDFDYRLITLTAGKAKPIDANDDTKIINLNELGGSLSAQSINPNCAL